MNVCSIEFLLLLTLGLAIFPWLPTVRLRQAFLSLCNAVFLYSLVPNNQSWIALGLFLLSGYLAARVLQAYPRRWILGSYLAMLLGAFLILKRYTLVSAFVPGSLFEHTVTVVGLSYMLFRQIHVAVDTLQGQIPTLSLWTFANYQLNLFGLVAGPIQRYQDFAEDWSSLAPVVLDASDIQIEYMRVFSGAIKISLIGDSCLMYYERFSTSIADSTIETHRYILIKFVLLLYMYYLYIYMNFTGYCDIVIGGGRLCGLRMPENFDSPLLARNMIDYWTRWHKTLGFWIRDYVFTPMYMTIASCWPSRAPSLAFLCYFVVLFLTGIWHGSTWNFVIFGVLNGLGVSGAKLWEMWLVRCRGRQWFKAYLQSMPIRIMAVTGTFHFVCFTMFFFSTELERSLRVLHALATDIAS